MSRRSNASASAAGLLLWLVLTVPAAAQSRSVFDLVEPEGSIAVGGEETGALSAADVRGPDDAYLDVWLFEGRAGQSVWIDLVSEDFDSYLYLVGPGFSETQSDDDGGGACHARLNVTFLENGAFRIVASTRGFGFRQTTGTYTLSVSTEPRAAAPYSCGGVNPTELFQLPTEGRSLALGRMETGVLPLDAPLVGDGRPGQAWALRGRAGQAVSITLRSEEFDTYLYVAGPGMDVMSDDDSAGDLDSRISFTFPTDQEYLVVAAALSQGSSGMYTISVDEPMSPNDLDTAGRSIGAGEVRAGMLTAADRPVDLLDGRRGQAWAFRGEAGQRVSIDLRSEDFDAYLYLVGPGIAQPLSDDDGGNGLNSRITTTLPDNGTYRIIVSALGSSATGSFELEVRSR